MADRILTVDQLIDILRKQKNRYKYSQVHHTYRPSHKDFNGKNHLALQQGMRNYHVNVRGWNDIGQHVTLCPDGLFVTGRDFQDDKVDFDDIPAGISGYNTGSFMVEMLGNFDEGHDKLEGEQLESILKLQHFLVTECGASILFHNEKASKSCPGTGINKKEFVSLVNNYKQTDESKGDVKMYLDKGDRGREVQIIQENLHKLGYGKLVGSIDGIFGNRVKSAVEAFQRDHGLKVDGIVGDNTINKIKELLSTPKPKESVKVVLGGKNYVITEA
jgi:hypothetical protein